MRGLAAISRLPSLGHKWLRAKRFDAAKAGPPPSAGADERPPRRSGMLPKRHHGPRPRESAPRANPRWAKRLRALQGKPDRDRLGLCHASLPSTREGSPCIESVGYYWALGPFCGSPWNCRIQQPRRLPDWFPIGVAPATAGNDCPTWPSPRKTRTLTSTQSFSPRPNCSFRCLPSPRGIDRRGVTMASARRVASQPSACIVGWILAESPKTHGVVRRVRSPSLERLGTTEKIRRSLPGRARCVPPGPLDKKPCGPGTRDAPGPAIDCRRAASAERAASPPARFLAEAELRGGAFSNGLWAGSTPKGERWRLPWRLKLPYWAAGRAGTPRRFWPRISE